MMDPLSQCYHGKSSYHLVVLLVDKAWRDLGYLVMEEENKSRSLLFRGCWAWYFRSQTRDGSCVGAAMSYFSCNDFMSRRFSHTATLEVYTAASVCTLESSTPSK
jgi:hypothetical protein